MRNGFLFLLSLLASLHLQAQHVIPDLSAGKTTADKLAILKKACDSLSAIEKYDEMQVVARKALELSPSNDPLNLALFNHYLAVSMEGLISRDSAIYYHEQALNYARQAKSGKRIRTAYQRLLFLYHSAGNEKKADTTSAILKQILDTTKSNYGKYEILVFLGNYYNERAEYEKNIEYLLKSLEIQKQILNEDKELDPSDIGITMLNIAKAYIDMKQPAKAIEYILPARPYFTNYISGQTYYHRNYLDALVQLERIPEAMLHHDTLNTIAAYGKAGAFGWSDLLSAELTLGDYYLGRNNTDSAYLFVKKASDLAPTYGSAYMQSQVNYMLGKVLAARKEYNKAIPLLKASEEMTRNASLQVHASLLQTLAQAYAATGQWQQAYDYYEKYAPLRDSLYAEASKKNIADAEASFQTKEKQQQIEVQNLQISQNRKQQVWLIAGIIALGLLAALLYAFYRNKKQGAAKLARLNNDLEEANRVKAKLFSIISHDLRSPISQVYQFLKLQQLNPDALNQEQKTDLSNKIQSATGSLLETMEDLLLWSKTQINEFKANIQPTQLLPVVNACQDLLQLNSEAKGIRYQKQVPADAVVHTDSYYLQTIIRNLLQNAIKASPQNGEIRIGTEAGAAGTIFYIQNEGNTFTQEDYQRIITDHEMNKTLDGFGLRLVDELSRKTGITLSFRPAGPSGTRAELLIAR